MITSSCSDASIVFLPQNASGAVAYGLTNDYLFRAVLQENPKVRIGLICSLLHLRTDEVHSVDIANPVELGSAIDAKDFVLDVKILLNNHTLLNLEMQVLNEGNWPDRSLSYLCRSFDQLNRGQNYGDAKPVLHISFLDFTLFSDHPEFYSTYMLLNVKNYTIYSDKFILSVVNLTQTKLATPEDKACHLDEWAALFKATTWEEIRMLASENEFIAEAAQTMYKLTAEEQIRQQCEAREDFYRQQNYVKYRHEKEMAEAREDFERQQNYVKHKHEKEMAEAREDFERQQNYVKHKHEQEMAEARAGFERQKQDTETAHEREMSEAREDFERQQNYVKHKHEQEMAEARAGFERQKQDTETAHEREMAEQKQQFEHEIAEKDALIARLLSEKAK